jgi:AefR-like transcriptional repressor, C-terminal domain
VDLLPLDQPVELVLERFARVFIERMMSPVGAGYPFYQLARVLVGATVRQPNISQSCKWIFADLIGAPLAGYFKSKIESGEIAGDDPAFLAHHFVQTLFFTNAVALDPSSSPRDRGSCAQKGPAVPAWRSGRPNDAGLNFASGHLCAMVG